MSVALYFFKIALMFMGLMLCSVGVDHILKVCGVDEKEANSVSGCIFLASLFFYAVYLLGG